MAPLRLLVVETGTPAEVVRAEHGAYPAWFARALDGVARLNTIKAHEGERVSPAAVDRAGAAGIVVTGSPLSCTAGQRQPWMDELGASLLDLGTRGVPVLGVCFGHQILGRAAGGDVVKNGSGREIGTVEIQVTEAGLRDPLFSWAQRVPKARIEVQATHTDAVDPLPAGVTILAGNENTPAQALRFSETVASVQFHPEFQPDGMKAIIESRREILKSEGLDPDALLAKVRKTEGREILLAFAEQCRRG